MVTLPSSTRMPSPVPEPWIFEFLMTTFAALIETLPLMSRPSITVPAWVTVTEPDAVSVTPAGTPVVDAPGHTPFDGPDGAGAEGVGVAAWGGAAAGIGASVPPTTAKASAAPATAPSRRPNRAQTTSSRAGVQLTAHLPAASTRPYRRVICPLRKNSPDEAT